MALVALVLLTGAIGFPIYAFKQLPVEKKEAVMPDFPVRGEFVQVKSVRTYWRHRNKNDRAKNNVVVLPVVNIELEGGTGGVRFLIEDESGTIRGDNTTLSVKDGKFNNGSTSYELTCTDGFEEQGLYEGYSVEETDFWVLRILEATSRNSNADDFKEIAKILLKPVFKENE